MICVHFSFKIYIGLSTSPEIKRRKTIVDIIEASMHLLYSYTIDKDKLILFDTLDPR